MFDHWQRAVTAMSESYEDMNTQIIDEIIQALDDGTVRTAMPCQGSWQVQSWVQQAILLYFKSRSLGLMSTQSQAYFDKIPLKYADFTQQDFMNAQIRVVPGTVIRHGAYCGKDVVLMPCFVNIGAYIDDGSMIDSYGVIGSCAQIGKRVHVAMHAGIGGVLEPIGQRPVIIEDDCFIGANSQIVEGVTIGSGAVIAMGVYLGGSTKIIDVVKDEQYEGYIPPNAVVIPGVLPAKEDQLWQQPAAIIVKYVDEKTRKKTGINAILRQAQSSLITGIK